MSRMKRLASLFSRYDAAVWIRVIGTVLTQLASYMIRPFLVFYLYDRLHSSIVLSMVVIGLQPLSGLFINLLGGNLTDRYGRKFIMIAALFIQGLSLFGFVLADSLWEFAICTFFSGMGRALFYPASSAHLSDAVPETQRAEAFALLHAAANLGAALGPLLGLGLFLQNPQLVFGISSSLFLIYILLLWWKLPETVHPERQTREISGKRAKLELGEHKSILWLTMLTVPIGLLYAQVDSTFPLHLKNRFLHYQSIFALLMTINATIVIALQVWLAKKTERLAPENVIFAAYMLFAIVCVGYGFAPNVYVLIVTELAFTVAEMIGLTHLQKTVSLLSPADLRGTYFSIFNMYSLVSKLIGPIAGGIILSHFGGEMLFSILAVFLFVSGFLQYRFIHRSTRTDANEPQSISP